MTQSSKYRIHKVGSKFDYVARYKVIDSTTGRRVDGVRGGLSREAAEDLVEWLTARDETR